MSGWFFANKIQELYFPECTYKEIDMKQKSKKGNNPLFKLTFNNGKSFIGVKMKSSKGNLYKKYYYEEGEKEEDN